MNVCEDRKVVSLDNPTIRALARNEPELFLRRYTPPVLTDEVPDMAKEWSVGRGRDV